MSILTTTKTISIIYFILPANQSDNIVSIAFIFTIDIFPLWVIKIYGKWIDFKRFLKIRSERIIKMFCPDS